MKIAVSSYSYHQKIKTEEMTQLDAVRAAKEMGFDGIEFTDLIPNSEPTLAEQLTYAKELRAEAERVGSLASEAVRICWGSPMLA